MEKIKVGIVTFSDGRKHIHDDLLETNRKHQNNLQSALEQTGEIEVVAGQDIVWDKLSAVKEAKRLAGNGVELTIFNYAIWCYPHLTAIASRFAPGPFLLFCNLHPSEPGMVGMLAAAGTLDQLDLPYGRVWGDSNDPLVVNKVLRFVKSAAAVKRLSGLTFGCFGGRPLGMYTAVSNLDQWQKMFGIDIEHIEQNDIVAYSREVPVEKRTAARKWLEERVGSIEYDGDGLTEEKLELQIASYYALRKIIDERNLDFIGIKAHGDLTEDFVTMDIAEAFLNDPYDWDGPHEPIIASTESDMDGALTMQIFKHLTGKPVLFSDVRHFDSEDNVWYFSNSGTHATYFGAVSHVPEVNLQKVTFYPEKDYYPAGGASVHTFAAPGKVTLARLARKNGTYHMTIVPGEFIGFDREKALAKGATVTPMWPIAFTRLEVDEGYFLNNFPCNHIHGVYGDYVGEMQLVAELMGIEYSVFSNSGRL